MSSNRITSSIPRTVAMAVLVIIPTIIIAAWGFSISQQQPMCWKSYEPQQAAKVMQNQDIHDGPHPAEAMDLSQVKNGFNTACDKYINKEDVKKHVGKWVQNDSYFREKSQWAPFHFTTVSIVGWDVLKDGAGTGVQTVSRVGAVNIFNTPLWWREQYLFANMDYHICAYFNETTRLIASARTKSAKVQTMVYTNTTENKPSDPRLKYAYDIVNAGPNTELLANNEYWGQTRLHFIDETDNDYGFGRKCYVWSRYFVDGSSITHPLFPVLAVIMLGAFAYLLNEKTSKGGRQKNE